jgi:hypothetical protein
MARRIAKSSIAFDSAVGQFYIRTRDKHSTSRLPSCHNRGVVDPAYRNFSSRSSLHTVPGVPCVKCFELVSLSSGAIPTSLIPAAAPSGCMKLEMTAAGRRRLQRRNRALHHQYPIMPRASIGKCHWRELCDFLHCHLQLLQKQLEATHVLSNRSLNES